MKSCFEVRRVCAKTRELFFKGIASRRKPFARVRCRRSVGYRTMPVPTVVLPRNRSRNRKCLANARKDFFALGHFRVLQYSLNDWGAIFGASRVFVHENAGSSFVPFTIGCIFCPMRPRGP